MKLVEGQLSLFDGRECYPEAILISYKLQQDRSGSINGILKQITIDSSISVSYAYLVNTPTFAQFSLELLSFIFYSIDADRSFSYFLVSFNITENEEKSHERY